MIGNKLYFCLPCIDRGTGIWHHSHRDLRNWRLNQKLLNPTSNVYSVEVRDVNGTWYPICARTDGVDIHPPLSLICQTATKMLTGNSSTTRVAAEIIQKSGSLSSISWTLTSLQGNCSMYGLVQELVYCVKGTGCPKINFTFLKFCSFKSKPPIATPKI